MSERKGDTPKSDTTKIIAVVPARWSPSGSLEATANIELMAVEAEDRRGPGVEYVECSGMVGLVFTATLIG